MLAPLLALLAVAGCSKGGPRAWQGYLEGDFVYVSSPLAGRLEKLLVAKGSRVAANSPLFELEHGAESDALRQASQQLQEARARLEDLKKGSRPEEIAALEARLGEARASAELSSLELARQDSLFKAGAVTASDYDHARLTHVANQRSVDEDSARLDTARLGGRADAVAAAGAAVRAGQPTPRRMPAGAWTRRRRPPADPRSSTTRSTARGRYVSAGSPVVVLLPPSNIKVRFFVAEEAFARIKAGDRVDVGIEGLASHLEATVSYLSPQPEYTPPVLYNRDNRSKLVYMVEAVFAPGAAADLHPGQPVDVEPSAR